MIEAELPMNEVERIQVLQEYGILDTGEEACYDDLVKLAAKISDAPISIVSLLDQDRSWFKSSFGLPRGEVDRKYSICSHAILQPEVFIVEDTALDERFADNPIVSGDLNVRFYAGAPLTSSTGHHLGTLCILDTLIEKLVPTCRQTRTEKAVSGIGRSIDNIIQGIRDTTP